MKGTIHHIAIIVAALCFPLENAGQCPITVDAGDGEVICAPGGTVQLNGSIDGPYIDYEWSPPTGLSNPNILDPVATVTSTTTYTLSATAVSDNLIQNGDFASGNTGFSSSYVYFPPGIPFSGWGVYTVHTTPSQSNSVFADCNDISGEGMMFISDGGLVPGVDFWCQSVVVSPNSDYVFSFWGTSIYPISPSSFQVFFNGSQVGPTFTNAPATCAWQQYTVNWNSGANTFVTICIQDVNTILSGNDFAIDDITLIGTCEVSDEVIIEVSEVNAFIFNPLPITCIMPTVILDGSLSTQTSGTTFEWTTFDGQILFGASTLFPEVGQAGTYTLTVIDENGCEASTSVTVFDYSDGPDIEALGSEINCLDSVVTLSFNGTGTGLSNLWTGPDNFQSTFESVEVDIPGLYILTVYDIYGCEAVDSVYVVDLRVVPDLLIYSDTLSCDQPLIQLDAESQVVNINFIWNGPNGFTSNIEDPFVDEPGWYVVSITDESGCTNIDSVLVFGDLALPQLNIISDSLSCRKDTVLVSVQFDLQVDIIEWNGPNQFTASSDVIQVSDPGWYHILATTPGGCKNRDSIFVEIDTIQPQFTLSTDTLDCNIDSLRINLDSGDPSFTYLWTGPANFQSEESDPWIYLPGVYEVLVVGDNGCIKKDSITVPSNQDLPSISVVSDTFNCNTDTLVLTGSSSAINGIYSWTGPGGFLSNEAETIVNQPGTYVLTVEDENGCAVSLPYSIPIDLSPPDLAIFSDTISCKKLNANISVSSSLMLDSITWSGPEGFFDVVPNPVVDIPGWYTIIATGQNGCNRIDSIYVNIDTIGPQIDLYGDTLTCDQDSLGLNPMSSENLSDPIWSGPLGFVSFSRNIFVRDPGIYTFSAAGENGCRSEISTEVFSDENLPALTFETDTISCKNRTVQLNIFSDISLFEISWSGPGNYQANGNNVTIIEGGTYTAEVETIEGCKTTASVNVFENLDLPVLAATADTITCDMPQVSLLDQSIDLLDSILWIGPGGFMSSLAMPSVSDGGSYNMVGWGLNGCSDTIIFAVVEQTDKPDLTLSAGIITCNNPNADITAISNPSQVVYSWSGPMGFISSLDKEEVSTGGWYHISIEAMNGCTSVDSVFVETDVEKPIFSLSAGELDCSTDSVQIDVQVGLSNFSFDWSYQIGNGSLQPYIQNPGWYVLELTNEDNGCSKTDSIRIIKSDEFPEEIIYSLDSENCESAEARFQILEVIGGSAPYQYILDGLDTLEMESIFEDLSSGTYVLEILDAKGCSLITDIEVPVYDILDIKLDSILEISYGESGQIEVLTNIPEDRINRIRWTPGTYLSCDDCLNPVISPERSSRYWVEITDDRGCMIESSIFVKVSFEAPIYIPNVFSPNDKNGVNDFFTIYASENVIEEINFLKVYSRWGELVFQRSRFQPNDVTLGWDGSFLGKKMNAGVFVYVAEVTLENGKSLILKGDITLLE